MELLPFHHHKLFLDVKSIMNLIVQVSGSITPPRIMEPNKRNFGNFSHFHKPCQCASGGSLV